MELCSGEGSRAEGGSPVMEGVKGFQGPPNLGGGNLGPQRHHLEAGASRPEGRAPSRQQQACGLSE